MRDPIILLVHLIATLARLMGPGGLRSVVAESLLVKQQLLILNRSRHRAPNLRASDRILAGVCALFMRPARVLRAAVVLRPSTILEFHRMLRRRKYRCLFSPQAPPHRPQRAVPSLGGRHCRDEAAQSQGGAVRGSPNRSVWPSTSRSTRTWSAECSPRTIDRTPVGAAPPG